MAQQEIGEVPQLNEQELLSKLEMEEVKLRSLETCVAENGALDNLLYVFGEVLKQDTGLTSIIPILSNMKETIEKIFQYTPQLKKFIGKDETNRLDTVLETYGKLLGKTKSTVKLLLEDAKIQKENINDTMNIIKKCNTDEMIENENENKKFDECLFILGKWIQSEDLSKLIDEWSDFCKICQNLCNDWNQIVKQAQKGVIKHVIGCVGGLLLGAGLMIGIIGVSIFGSPLAGATMVATAIKIGSVAIAKHLMVACGLAGAGLITLAAGYLLISGKSIPKTVLKQAENIRECLRQMLMIGKQITIELNEMNDFQNAQVSKRLETLKNVKTKSKIITNLNAIDDYLNSYCGQGYKIIKEIDNAQQDFLKILRKIA